MHTRSVSLCLLLAGFGLPSLLPAADPVPANFFGLHIVNGNYPTVPVGALRTVGASWSSIQARRGAFNWSALDAQVKTALAHNMKMAYSTDQVPSWAAKDRGSCSSGACSSGVANIADWDTFVTALVTRYKGKIEAYGLWDEPDGDFSGPMSDFLPLAQHFHDIIRATDPAALVLSPGPVNVSWLDSYWAAGGVTDIDAVQFHGPFSTPVAETVIAEKITPLKAILAKYGLSSKAIWDTSDLWGNPTSLTDLQAQAAFVARSFLLHWSNGVTRTYWYSWDDNGNGPNGQGYGALANWQSNAPYPAATAYSQVENWMVGAVMSTPCSVAGDNTWTCGLTRDGNYQALAIWNVSGSKQYTPAANYTQYRDLAGHTNPIAGQITIGSQPILLVGNGTTPPLTTPPQITTSSLAAGQLGAAYNAILTASGGAMPYAWSISSGSLPAGLSLDASTGAITGTPTTAGQSSFTAKVIDSATSPQSATIQLSVTVTISTPPPTPPRITTSSLPAGKVGVVYSVTLAASGGATPYTWSIATGALSAGLGLNPSTGAITGTPTAAGSGTFTVQVSGAGSLSATKPLSITISAAAPPPPQITTSSLPAGQVGLLYSATIAASGGTTPYRWSLATGALSAGLSLNPLTGAITGTPTAAGSSTFTVQVSDAASQSATKPLSIGIANVTPPVTPPGTAAIPASFFGMHIQETSTNWPTVSIGAYRTSAVSWPKMEPQQGVFTWGEMDRQVALAIQHGVPIYYATDGIPRWFSTSNMADWDNYITTLATRYKGKIEIYELWNEPEYDNLPPIATFVTMMKHMRDIIRSIDPGAKIASPGVDTISYIDGFWAAGGPKDVDIVALHGYPHGSQPETVIQKATEMRGYMSKYGIDKPLYDSEGSYGDAHYGVTSTADKINFIPRYELLQWSNGITRHYWYSWDDSTDGNNGIGWGTLYDAVKHQVLPMAATYQQTYNWMVGATLSTPCSMAGDSTWSCGLTRPGGYQALAIWNASTSKQYTPASIYTQYKDLSGNVKPISGSVTIGASAILLEGSGGTPPPPPPTLQITTSALPGGQTGSAYNAGLALSGGTAPYSWSTTAGSLPAGLSLDAATGTISGTPTTASQSTFTVRVGDAGASPQSATAQLSLTVSATPPPPPPPPALLITTPSLAAAQVGTAYGELLSASGGTTPTSWSLSAGSLPAGLTLSAGGAISGTPTASGLSTFTVRVADSASTPQSATKQLSINVTTSVAPLLVTTSSLPAGQVQSAYGAALAASGGTTPTSWSLSAGSLPAGLSLSAGGAISGTPTASGLSTFTVRVADSASTPQSATKQLSINITTAPVTLLVITSSLPAGQVQSAYGATLAASGATTSTSWNISSGSLPAGLTLSPAGAISGTPTASGLSTFSVSVTDSASTPQSATKQLSINIAAATLHIQTTSLPDGQVAVAYNTTLAGQGGTLPYTWSVLGTLPAGLSLSSMGALTGTPSTAATSSFTIQVTDSVLQTASASFSIKVSAASTASVFNHVVVIVEENMNYDQVIGSSLMPYLNSLASTYGSATQYYANTHPSIGNYLWMVTGQQLTNDDSLDPSSFPVSANNVVRQLLAGGKTWKSYAEDLPSAGYTGGDTGNYAVRHNPLAYLTDVQNSSTQKQNLVPFTQFGTDLSNNALPNYSFVVPNLCNDAHDCGIDVADSWLQAHIAPLVNNASFQKDGILIILFDESADDNAHGGGRIPFIVVSGQGKAHVQSTTFYQHQSLLRLTLQALGIKNWPGAAANAPSMSEFFTVPLP